MKLLLGGSPCTHWSIAQTKNRETEPSGIGWELFKNYLIAREKYKPDYFLYENNKSMAAAIREQITKELGVPPVLINSALVSAQNRQRLYWAGKRMPDGSYTPLDIQQPEDRGILLRDILETVTNEKGYILKPAGKPLTEREMDYMVRETSDGRNHFDFEYHHDATEDKSACVTANTHRGVPYNVVAEPIITVGGGGKSHAITSTYANATPNNTLERHQRPMIIECINPTPGGKSRTVDAHMKNLEHCLVPRINDLNPAKQQYDCIAEPVNVTADGKAQCLRATYYKDGIRNMVGNDIDRKTCAAEPIRIGTIDSDTKHPDHDSQQYRVYSEDGKSVTLCGAGGVLEPRPDCMQSGSAPAMRVREATKRGDMRTSCRENARTCPCRAARQGGADL